MLTEAERLTIEIASLDRQIEANDKAMEQADDRQSMRRRHGDDLFRRRLKAQAQLEREQARLVKPQPKGVQAGCYDV